MSDYKLLIDGKLLAVEDSLPVINPADETLVANCPLATGAHLEDAVAAAKRAGPAWAAKSFAERRGALLAIADVLKANAEDLSTLLTLEQGKPKVQADAEVAFSEIFCRHFADQSLDPEVLFENEGQRVEVHRKPLGVVAGIMPWNFPLLIAVYKLAPALIVGNTLLLKPAPTTPLSVLKLGELIADILPPGVINILTDNNDLGPMITAHKDIAKISFTGSTPTGKAIMAAAAPTLKRLTLELGGNDAAIVLDDVDPKQAAQGIFGAAFLNSGQVCIALKRLYVHESIYDEVCEEIAVLARGAKVANGFDSGAEFGPVQNRAQYDKICNYLVDAREHGNIIAGGEVSDEPGFFVPLTVVKDIEDGTAVVDEEPFGPILPILKFSSEADVIARANNSAYGLGGSVWSADPERARQLSLQLDCGTVWINQHCAFGPNIPFPPAKESGLGVEWGEDGLKEFTAMQVVNINTAYQEPVH